MKIKQEHYRIISNALNAVGEKLNAASKEYKQNGMSEMRFRWDVFYFAKIEGNSTKWLCDNLYSYLNDSHIDTALRQYFGHNK